MRSLAIGLLLLAAPARAQVDPERRKLLQLGYDRALEGPRPTGAYLFYYMNEPHFVRKDLTLRVALAPVYVDTELGIDAKATGESDSVAVGLAGGGFADSYAEVRGGHYFKEESFRGHGGTVSLSFYRNVLPEIEIPLHLIARGAAHMAVYEKTGDTRSDFSLPPDHRDYNARFGLRFGGSPPELLPARAGELSLWYVPYVRDQYGDYGINGDRRLERFPQLYWTRFLVAYRLETASRFEVSAEAGGSTHADRLSAYRLGGMLPFASEFPLALPGFYNGELSARRYALLGGRFTRPITSAWQWDVSARAANVAFVPGLEQTKPWNTGLSGGLAYGAPGDICLMSLSVGYGIDAIRSGGRGGFSIATLAQLDIEAWHKKTTPKTRPSVRPAKPQGVEWLGQLFGP